MLQKYNSFRCGPKCMVSKNFVFSSQTYWRVVSVFSYILSMAILISLNSYYIQTAAPRNDRKRAMTYKKII